MKPNRWERAKEFLEFPGVRIPLLRRRTDDGLATVFGMYKSAVEAAMPDCPFMLFLKASKAYSILLCQNNLKKAKHGTSKSDLYAYWYRRTLDEMYEVVSFWAEWQHQMFPQIITLDYFMDVTRFACQKWEKFRLWDRYLYNNGNRGPEKLEAANIGPIEWFGAWSKMEDNFRHDRGVPLMFDEDRPLEQPAEGPLRAFVRVFGTDPAENKEDVDKTTEQESSGDVAGEEHFEKSQVAVLPQQTPEDILMGRTTMQYPVKAKATMSFNLTFPCEESIVRSVLQTMQGQYSVDCGAFTLEDRGGGEAVLTTSVDIDDVHLAIAGGGTQLLVQMLERVDKVYGDMMGMCLLQEEIVRRAKGAWNGR